MFRLVIAGLVIYFVFLLYLNSLNKCITKTTQHIKEKQILIWGIDKYSKTRIYFYLASGNKAFLKDLSGEGDLTKELSNIARNGKIVMICFLLFSIIVGFGLIVPLIFPTIRSYLERY